MTAVVTVTDPPTFQTSSTNKDLTSQLRLGGSQCQLLICSFTKAIKARCDRESWSSLKPELPYWERKPMPLHPFLCCLLCQRGCSDSLLLQNTGPQGLEWSRIITNRSLIGMDSMETSQSGRRHLCLNYSSPRLGAPETANKSDTPKAKGPDPQLHPWEPCASEDLDIPPPDLRSSLPSGELSGNLVWFDTKVFSVLMAWPCPVQSKIWFSQKFHLQEKSLEISLPLCSSFLQLLPGCLSPPPSLPQVASF